MPTPYLINVKHPEKKNIAVTFVRPSRRTGLSSSRAEKGRREGGGRGGRGGGGSEEGEGSTGVGNSQSPAALGHDA